MGTLYLLVYWHNEPEMISGGNNFKSSGVRNGNPIPPRDREPGVNAINKAEFIGLVSQGRAPTRTCRTG
jgi:hypothetical protein